MLDHPSGAWLPLVPVTWSWCTQSLCLPLFVGGWYFSIGQVNCIFTCFVGGFLDLGNHHLLIVAYPSVVGEFFELLEELFAIWEVHLSELFPLRPFDLFVGILPEPFLEIQFEIFVGGV